MNIIISPTTDLSLLSQYFQHSVVREEVGSQVCPLHVIDKLQHILLPPIPACRIGIHYNVVCLSYRLCSYMKSIHMMGRLDFRAGDAACAFYLQYQT